MSNRALLHDLSCLLAVLAGAWAVHLYARVLPTSVLAALWVVLGATIAAALWVRARRRRRAFLAVHVLAESPFQHRLRGGPFMALRVLLPGGLLGLALLLALARSRDPGTWMVLLAAMPVLVLLRAAAWRAMAGHLTAPFLPLLSWRVASLATGAALVAAGVLLALQRSYPDFAGVGLERAVWHLVDQEQARSGILLALLQGLAAADGLRLWLAQQLLPVPGTSAWQLLGWAVVLAEETLFVWSYLLLAHGVLTGVGAHDRGPH